MGSRSSRGTDMSALVDFCVAGPDVDAAALAAAAAAVVDVIESVRLREAGSICMTACGAQLRRTAEWKEARAWQRDRLREAGRPRCGRGARPSSDRRCDLPNRKCVSSDDSFDTFAMDAR